MPDFATPPGDSSAAHTRLAAAVHVTTDDAPIPSVNITWFIAHGAIRFATVDTVASSFNIHADTWWGRVN
jgi:hypothetical protein